MAGIWGVLAKTLGHSPWRSCTWRSSRHSAKDALSTHGWAETTGAGRLVFLKESFPLWTYRIWIAEVLFKEGFYKGEIGDVYFAIHRTHSRDIC